MQKIEFPYHLHVDATVLPLEVEDLFKSSGFIDADFAGHPEGYRHFEPLRHMTMKLEDFMMFSAILNSLKAEIAKLGFVGYIEGERLISDVTIPPKPYDDLVPLPFQIERRLLTGTHDEQFRQTEVHLVLDKDNSDSRLIKKLLDAGLYGAYIRKKDYTALVLTIQGFKSDVDPLTGALWAYLNQAGGAVRCSIQEERAIGHHLVGIDHTKLPEIVGKVTYISADMKDKYESAVKEMRKTGATPGDRKVARIK